MRNIFAAIFIAFFLILSSAHPATILVPSVQPTIQAGIDVAQDGDTVLVADGTYTGLGNCDIDFTGARTVVVRSENGPLATIIDAEGSTENRSRCFTLTSQDSYLKLQGFTLTGGYGYFGGAVLATGAPPEFMNCVFTDNHGVDGGAVTCEGTAAVFDTCIFTSNVAGTWGGAVCLTASLSVFTECLFVNNSTIYRGGGAVFCQGSSPEFNDCEFINNFAKGYGGGGIWAILGSHPTLTYCTFAFNEAPTGGGITYWSGSALTLTNCTLFGNSAYQDGYGNLGGAIYAASESGTASTYENSIFAFNTKGTAIAVKYAEYEVNLACCDIYGNTGGDWIDYIADQATINGNFSENPRFCHPDGGDLALQETSPCATTANSCGVLIGAWDVECEDITLPIIHCPVNTLTGLPDAEGTVCVTLVIENVEDGTVDAGAYTWADNQLCLTGITNGTYGIRVIATNDDGADTCWVEVYVRFPETIRVPGDASTIQAAIDAALDNDTVLVGAGEYTGTGNRDIDFKGKRIIVRSEYGAKQTVINCESDWGAEYRGFYFHSGEDGYSILDGFTITDGFGSNWGGAISCDSASSPHIRNCIFSDNFANISGGGVGVARNSNPLVENCVFKYNSADSRGGGISVYRSSPVVRDCVFSGCSSPSGMAVYCEGSDAPYTPFTQEYPCEPEFYNCLFLRSLGGYIGTAMTYGSADPLFSNCTFYGNPASFGGSAIYAWEATGRFEYCIVAFNSDGDIGPVYCEDATATPTFECCNLYGNASGDWTGCIAGQGSINNNMSVDPLFCDTTGYLDPNYEPTGYNDRYTGGDFHLTEGSPCGPGGSSCGVLVGALVEGCANTPAGDDVQVVSVETEVTITFDNIYEAGDTQCETDTLGPDAPGGFMTTPSDPPTYYNITTTAGYDGDISICITYDPAFAPVDETDLKLMHYDGNDWVDITTEVDSAGNFICGITSSLSPFIIAQPTGTGVKDPNSGLPTRFSLSQNYPNPFNPNTEILFALPRSAQVKLNIYNIVGQRVATLVDRHMDAGYHSIQWDGRNSARESVASGIYFYKLTAGEFVDTKKMLLLK